MAGALVVAVAWSAAAASARTLYVAPSGNNANHCTLAHPCKTIGRGVGVARRHDTVVVEAGTYRQDVRIGKDIRVIGSGHPVDNVHGRDNGFVIQGPKAAGAVVSGFIVKNAVLEGILVVTTSDVTVSNNTVMNNDQGVKASKPVGECAASGEIPGDCGEGIHLMSVTGSRVVGNVSKDNTGGILLTDELGPTAHNLISSNTVLNNVLDCGITVAGHSPNAIKGGVLQPTVAGIYKNTITKNIANGNGTKGEGAGILLAAGGPGSAVYNNLVSNNTANGNGLAGVTLHSHAPGQDLNGNKITGNSLTHDGVNSGSESEFGENGKTVGILVGSSFTKLSGTVISGNTIRSSYYGVFTKNVPPIKKTANTFHLVTVPLMQT